MIVIAVTRVLFVLALPLLVGAGACSGGDEMKSVPLPPGSREAPPPPSKVIVCYAPGLDPAIVERGIRDGYLPHLRRLRIGGTLVSLGPSSRGALWSGRSGATIAEPLVRWVPGREAVTRSASDVVPEKLPALDPGPSFGGLVDDLASAGHEVIGLRAPLPLVVGPSEKKKVLAGGGLPAASFDDGRFLFVAEAPAEAGPDPVVREVPGGRVIDMPPTSRSEDTALFVIDVEGPRLGPLGPGEEPLVARVEIRTTRDRMRAEVTSRDDRTLAVAGVFTKPIRLRFEPSKDVATYGRARIYIRPTGRERLELYVDPIDFDAVLPPAWSPVSSPPEFAAALEKEHGPLPRFAPAFPRAAFEAGLLDWRDAAAALDADLRSERELLGAAVADGGFRALVYEFGLIADARWLAARVPPETEIDVEFAGRRTPLSRLEDSVAGSFDSLIGEVLARIDKRERREEIALIVAASAPDEQSGVFAMSRLAYDVTPGRPIEDVAATVFAMLDLPVPAGVTGQPFPLGSLMERKVESRFTEKPVEEPEPTDQPAADEATASNKG